MIGASVASRRLDEQGQDREMPAVIPFPPLEDVEALREQRGAMVPAVRPGGLEVEAEELGQIRRMLDVIAIDPGPPPIDVGEMPDCPLPSDRLDLPAVRGLGTLLH